MYYTIYILYIIYFLFIFNLLKLTRKDLLVKNVKRMIKTVEKEYGKDEAAKYPFFIYKPKFL